MGLISDQKYLRDQQYRSPENLDARMQIHERFSRNKCGWHRWVFDHLHIHPGMCILELGCGVGKLWQENLAHLLQNIKVVLTDYSAGMVAEARGHLRWDRRFSFAQCDAQNIPVKNMSVDLVVANHMLYHVPNIASTIDEIARVLRPQGWLAAATNGPDHMSELYALMRRFDPDIRQANDSALRFGLQNGSAKLARAFPNRDVFYYDDALWVTESQPLVAYIASMWGTGKWDAERLFRLNGMIDNEIKEKGGFFIHKSTGMFWARRR